MQINELPTSYTFASDDIIVIEINNVTYKLTGATLASALKAVGNYLVTGDVANNLTTEAAGKVLDARQGKVLNDSIATKQGVLTFDTVPTDGSTNPVESNGIYDALALKLNTANVYNGLDKTAAGYALDARQGKVLNSYSLLLHDEIPDTVQTITFDSTTGNVSTITHTRDGTAIRTDAFTFGTGTITEVRTLNTGESLTITTNTTTLTTTVTYAA